MTSSFVRVTSMLEPLMGKTNPCKIKNKIVDDFLVCIVSVETAQEPQLDQITATRLAQEICT